MAAILPLSASPVEAVRAARAVAPEARPAGEGGGSPAVVNHVGRDAPEERAQTRSPNESDEAHAAEIRALAKRDAEVRAHEQAHAAAGGAFAGAPSYEYQQGPDGRSYAVSGEVSIDVSVVAGDPEATIQKMEQVRRAALAPRDPSDADRAIAATAAALILAARSELMAESGSATGEAQGVSARAVFGGYAAASAYELAGR